jgi:hypothetical protein
VGRVYSESPETPEVHLLDIEGRRFHDDLELIIVLEPVRVFSVPAVGWSPRRLNVRGVPRLRSKDTEEGGGMKRSCTHFHIVGLTYDTPFSCPERLQLEYEILKIHDYSAMPLKNL